MRAPTVVVMAKAPRPGTVKTRLETVLGPHGCAALQAELIRHTTTLTRARYRTVVAFAPAQARGELVPLVAPDVVVFPQSGGDLGQRMAGAVAEAQRRWPAPVLVIGTDVPTLTGELLAQAAGALAGGADCVLGPALDGGYYLIGLDRPRPELFALPSQLWGGPRVLGATEARAAELGLGVRRLAVLRDLDSPDDAGALLDGGRLPPSIAAMLARQLAGRR